MMMEQKTSKDKANQQTKHRSPVYLAIFCLICLSFGALFTGLGIWQIERLQWKTALIAAVDSRVKLPPVEAPRQAEWSTITEENSTYLPVKIHGQFLNDKEIFVTTVAMDSSGYWVMTPLKRDDGSIVFINRGFVPMDRKDQSARKQGIIHGETTVVGLLRSSEGTGIFPRKNNPHANLWYNRNPQQFAEKLHLNDVAPFFIDADKTPNAGGLPVGGLTVISFHNSHLIYIITWFILAVGVFGATIFVIVDEIRTRKNGKKRDERPNDISDG